MRTYGELTYNGGFWYLKAEPHVTMMLKRIFPRVPANREGVLTLSDTPSTAVDLDWVMTRWPLDLSAPTHQHLLARLEAHRVLQAEVDAIMAGSLRLGYERVPLRQPKDHQVSAADLALKTGHVLLTDPLGGMKSFSGLLMLRHPESLPALVVCPAHLCRQWLAELHASFDLRGHIVRTTAVYDPAKHRTMKGHQPDVLILTYTKLGAWAPTLAGKIKTVIFDEAQELRRVGVSPEQPTIKYAGACQIAARGSFRMELTNTPIYNYGDEIFNVLDVIAPGELGTRGEFYREWCTPLGNGKQIVRAPVVLGTWLRDNHLLLGRSGPEIGMERDDPIRIPWSVDVDQKVLAAESAGAQELAALILAPETKPDRRFTTGGELDWRMRRATGLAKAPFVAAFVRMLLESERKVLLAGWHRDVYDVWNEIFTKADVGSVMYTGSESPAAKEKAKKMFVEYDWCRVMMMSLRSGVGIDGIERSGCRVAVFGELDWSPGVHTQLLGRLNRGDHRDPVLGYYVTCDFGSDPIILETQGVKRGQTPIVDPDVSLFTPAETGDRVRQLAQAVMSGAAFAPTSPPAPPAPRGLRLVPPL